MPVWLSSNAFEWTNVVTVRQPG